jgi:Zn-finger nucleic acid-binding protein
VTIVMCYVLLDITMSELSDHNCPRCKLGLYIETSEQAEGVDLLICKECWGVAVAAKSMESVISNGRELDEKRADSNTQKIGCDCPICSAKMKEIELDVPEEIRDKLNLIDISESKKVIIDSCENCPTFWFDAGELDLLNGIQPKLRGGFFDPEADRLIGDKTLTEEDLYRKTMVRKGAGVVVVAFAAYLAAQGGIGMIFVAGILGIGGVIAILSRNPDQALAKGTCDKCLKENKSLAWNCQRGGCWAHICTDCQTVGADPVEAYAKTLGQVAIGVVVLGVGILAITSVAGGGGAALDGALGAAATSKSKKDEKGQKIALLLCRECVKVSKKESKAQAKIAEDAKTLEELNHTHTTTQLSDDSERIPPPRKLEMRKSTSDGYCKYIDNLNDKKCQRLEFRSSGYCYVHK